MPRKTMCQYGECESDAAVRYESRAYCELHAFGLLSKRFERVDVKTALKATMDKEDFYFGVI